jgi:hypothetical protein
MLGQAPYTKEVFLGVINERIRIFLIKKCLPVLPTLAKYTNAIDLLKGIKKEDPLKCDWYKEFLDELKSTNPAETEFSYKIKYSDKKAQPPSGAFDMSDFYRFAAFIVKNIHKNQINVKWYDGTLSNAILEEGTKLPLGYEDTPASAYFYIDKTPVRPKAGEGALQEAFVNMLNLILQQAFSSGVNYTTNLEWCDLSKDKGCESSIFDMDFYYPSVITKYLPNELVIAKKGNQCCEPEYIPLNIFKEVGTSEKKNPLWDSVNSLAFLLEFLYKAIDGITSYEALIEQLIKATPAERCWICKRGGIGSEQVLKEWFTPAVVDIAKGWNPSFDWLGAVEDDITEGLDDEDEAVLVRVLLNCEEFGLPTFKDTNKKQFVIDVPGIGPIAVGGKFQDPFAWNNTIFNNLATSSDEDVKEGKKGAYEELWSTLTDDEKKSWDKWRGDITTFFSQFSASHATKDHKDKCYSGTQKVEKTKCNPVVLKEDTSDRSDYHYDVFTRITDLILYETVKAYLV